MGQKGISWDAIKAIQCICVDTDSKMPGTNRAIRLVFREFFFASNKKNEKKKKGKEKEKSKHIPGKQKPLWQWLSIQ